MHGRMTALRLFGNLGAFLFPRCGSHSRLRTEAAQESLFVVEARGFPDLHGMLSGCSRINFCACATRYPAMNSGKETPICPLMQADIFRSLTRYSCLSSTKSVIRRCRSQDCYTPLKAERANDAKVYEAEKFTTYTLTGYISMHYSIKKQVFPVSNKIAIFAPNLFREI